MFKSLRVPANLFKLAMWAVSFVFAGFLIGLGSSLVADLPRIEDRLSPEQFADAAALAQARTEVERESAREQQAAENRRVAQAERNAAANQYRAARESFDNWLATRKATSDPAQDPEVLQRTRALDELKTAEAQAQARLDRLARDEADAGVERERAAERVDRVMAAGDAAYQRALQGQELRVFGSRLALTLPLLALAGWMLARKRGSDYWPLFRGFVVFAAFTFFVELVPYLPSYGGYVRSGVGIVVTVLAGHYVIKAMRRYLAQREAAAAKTEAERRQSLSYEDALKKLGGGVCPGCERAVMAATPSAELAAAATKGGAPAAAGAAMRETNFCVHCGMKLFDRCGGCSTRKNAFFHYCPSCGDPADRPEAPTPVAEPAPKAA